jgi:polysaccharide pyruvyl transferase WcaK-like protein
LIGARAKALLAEFVDEEIIPLDRFKAIDDHLDTINKARCVILCGGPAYTSSIYPGVYPLTEDLSKIKVPIIPYGLGWSGKPMNDPLSFQFDEHSKAFLNNVHKSITASSCRDVLTEQVLKNQGIKNVTMTGCPVWYDLPSIGKSFKENDDVKKIVITTPASQALLFQTLKVVRLTKKKFPKAKLYLSFHRGILPGKGNGMRKFISYALMCLGSFFIKPSIKITNVEGDLRKIKYYDDCDFHIGYRVHAHLYFLSKRIPSILINEDGRGRGQVLSMELPEFNIDDPKLIEKLSHTLDSYKKEKFNSFKRIGTFIDQRFEIMKSFLAGIK